MAMNSSTVQDHYGDIASSYDYFYRERNDAVIDLLLSKLSLQPHHVVADIGSGTGYIAERLFLSANLRNPIWCIDPCAEMQEQAKKKKGVLPMQMTASEFFAKRDLSCRFDRVISIGSCHHLSDPLEVYKGVKRSLNPGGVCMFTCAPTLLTDYPLFSRATSLTFSSLSLSPETILSQHHYRYLQEAGFEVTYSEVQLKGLSMKKAKWYEMLRGNWVSALRKLTTQEIEEGIKELENGKLKGIKFDETIHISQTEGMLEAIIHE